MRAETAAGQKACPTDGDFDRVRTTMDSRRRQLVAIDRLCERIGWADLDPRALRRLIASARAEDLSGAGLQRRPARRGDVTTRAVVGRESGRAVLRARKDSVVCGLPLMPLILAAYRGNVRFKPRVRDGAAVKAGAVLGEVSGPARTIITSERVLLNFLQRLSGIATHTAQHVRALGRTRTRLLDTRKTTPGWRALEKYAVACGGGFNHRLGLFDRVLIKDNHLAATGATRGERLANAVHRARRRVPGHIIEVEADDLGQLSAIITAGADIVLLDNFSPAQLRRAVALCRGKIWTEASGGISRAQLPALARLGLNFISIGGLIHQSTWVDIGLDWC